MWKYLHVWELLEESLTMNLTKNGDLSNNERIWCWEWSNANSIKPSDFFDKNGEVWFWSEWLSGDRSAACRISLLRRSEGAKEKNILSKQDYYINISGKICSWKSRIIVDVISNRTKRQHYVSWWINEVKSIGFLCRLQWSLFLWIVISLCDCVEEFPNIFCVLSGFG